MMLLLDECVCQQREAAFVVVRWPAAVLDVVCLCLEPVKTKLVKRGFHTRSLAVIRVGF